LSQDAESFLDQQAAEDLVQRLREGPPSQGLPLPPALRGERPVVSLDDARKAADDFLLLRTTGSTVREFLRHYDLGPLARRVNLDWLTPERRVLIVRTDEPGRLTVYDERLQQRLELEVLGAEGYLGRGGQEYPAAGLRVLRVWDGAAALHDLMAEDLVVRPR